MQSFSDLVSKRESCRSFISKPVGRKELEYILDTARMAPSACNSQPWHFTAATGTTANAAAKCFQFSGINKFTEKCPAFIVINDEKVKILPGPDGISDDERYAQIDIGIAAAHICYAALDVGLSTCIIGMFDEDKLRDLLLISPEKRIRLVIAVGYASNKPLHMKTRRELKQTATFIE